MSEPYLKLHSKTASWPDLPLQMSETKTTERYLQAEAWAYLARNAQKASRPVVDDGGEPHVPHLGLSPRSNLYTLGTNHQPKQDQRN
jgi:hypothetical protein